MFRKHIRGLLLTGGCLILQGCVRTIRIMAQNKILMFTDVCGKNIKISEMYKSYGNTQNISAKMENILKTRVHPINTINMEFHYSRLWTCLLKLSLKEELTFKGLGVTKRTAEHNSRLAALLWLEKSQNLISHEETITNLKVPQKKIGRVVSSRLRQKKPKSLFKLSVNDRLKGYKQDIKGDLDKASKTLLNSNLRIKLMQNRHMTTNAINEEKIQPVNETRKNDLVYVNTPTIQELHQKFPNPKQTLNNFYQIVTEQRKDKSLKPSPIYKAVKEKGVWLCTYPVKWPTECRVCATGKTKQTASTHAALRTLQFLKDEKRITEDGMPIVYSKEDVKRIIRETHEVLDLSNVLPNMQNIIDIYTERILPRIKDTEVVEPEIRKISSTEDNLDIAGSHKQRFMGLKEYLSREKVDLPIARYKESFMDLMRDNSVIIIKGEPGCGKSTRIPQYVLEHWAREVYPDNTHCRIAVAQPRKIAAISLAERVAAERDDAVGRIVGYQVRFQNDFNSHTGRILYCTSGILIRHLQSDPYLRKFTHVILDEAHERDVNIDLLMSLLKIALKANAKFKLIIMSATIDTDEFQRYYEGAAVLNVPGFTYPVTQQFLDNCPLDVSMTLKMCESEYPNVCHEDIAKVVHHIHQTKKEGAILVFLPGWEDITKVQALLPRRNDMAVYCLHSKLKNTEQMRIFRKPPPGIRKVILSTNIAETSITIDDVVYVVDSGIFKNKVFDSERGINVMDQYWIAKANVTQRSGRAGRCRPGESYHMYPRSKFDTFRDYKLPDILGTSLTKIVLDSKTFPGNRDAVEFMNELPTPPETSAVVQAVRELKDMELLDADENLTPLGRTLVHFQLEPKLAKTMVNSVVYKCVTPIVDVVTLFSSDVDIFASTLTDKGTVQAVKKQFSKTSDHLAMMRLLEKWLELVEETDDVTVERFCSRFNLASQRLEYIAKLRAVHFDYLYNGLYEAMPIADDLSDNDALVLSVLYSGVGTVLQHRNWDVSKSRLKTNTNRLITKNNHKATIGSESVNFKRHAFPSKYLVYINETRSNFRKTTLVRECSLIPTVSVLLFSNKDVYIKTLGDEERASEEMAVIGVNDSHVTCTCDKSQAEMLARCKQAMKHTYDFLIGQLTRVDGDTGAVGEAWQAILKEVDTILHAFKVD
ncbi:ATP-dependent RNA helicase DHX30-like [Cylas formicarius]|uniref:ATP-dependent RNA helicase DHX30-like n=1 Tax=Cylas formicarius TaxID=197179 RepID=UPI0029589EF1|nr:ATP-dependent RNA helicase DHX30-like [Cylas formicarius]